MDRDHRGDQSRSRSSCRTKRHYGLIDKLAFIKRSRLQATYQSEERDKGAAEPLLSPSLPLHHGKKTSKWNGGIHAFWD